MEHAAAERLTTDRRRQRLKWPETGECAQRFPRMKRACEGSYRLAL